MLSSLPENSHHCDDIIAIFNQLFLDKFATCLIGGADEPLYLPKSENSPYHQIFFRADYFASSLHEVAHWCLAGPERRLLTDYGYWYAADGRNAEQQVRFEHAEVKPQALEKIFCEACHYPFQPSQDNLGLAIQNDHFAIAIQQQAAQYRERGLPTQRAVQFADALKRFYKNGLMRHNLVNINQSADDIRTVASVVIRIK